MYGISTLKKLNAPKKRRPKKRRLTVDDCKEIAARCNQCDGQGCQRCLGSP